MTSFSHFGGAHHVGTCNLSYDLFSTNLLQSWKQNFSECRRWWTGCAQRTHWDTHGRIIHVIPPPLTHLSKKGLGDVHLRYHALKTKILAWCCCWARLACNLLRNRLRMFCTDFTMFSLRLGWRADRTVDWIGWPVTELGNWLLKQSSRRREPSSTGCSLTSI